MNVRAERFPLFDSMRAIAFLSVFVAHASFFAGLAVPGHLLRPYVSRLDVGVRIFFLISAFLLYRPFAAARMRGESPPLVGAYGWRRFLRVAPPYWLALTVIGIWLGSSGVYTWTHFPLYSMLWHALPPFRFPRVPERLLPIACLCIAALAALTFVPFHVVHPMRIAHLRAITTVALVVWALLAILAVANNLNPPLWADAGLLVLAIYFVAVGFLRRHHP